MADHEDDNGAPSGSLPTEVNEEEFFACLAIKKSDDELGRSFATGSPAYVAKVVAEWRSGEAAKEESDELEEPELPLETTQEATLHEALRKAVAFAQSQTHLIALTTVAPTVFEHINVMANIFGPITESSKPIEEDETATVYALTVEQYERFEKARKNLSDYRLGVAALPNATLMSLVATFDALVVDLLAKMLRLNKSWMERGERKLSFARLASAASLEELISEAINEEMYQFSRGSHDDQAKYIETNFGVSIRSRWKRWPDYIEVFERRNLVAHGESAFNSRYISICSAAGHKGSEKLLQEPIEVRPTYLRQAVDILTEFAILLPFSVWRKLSDEEEEKAFAQLNEAAYSLIINGRYVAAERVLEFALNLTKVKVPASVIQMLTINRASALKHAGFNEQADSVIDGVDWSASSDLYKICMHSVRGNSKEVAQLLPPLAKSEKISAATFKQWPCFSFVREDEMVRQAFLETFGEPLGVPARQTPGATGVDEKNPGERGQTVH